MKQKRATPRSGNFVGVKKWSSSHTHILTENDKANIFLGLMFGIAFGIVAFHAIVTGVA